MKKLLSILGATFIFLGAYTFAKSEECTETLTHFVEVVTKDPVNTVSPITPEEKAQLYAKKGPPPVEEPFELDVARTPDVGMIVIVKDGCIIGNVGPLPRQMLNNLLGDVES